MHYYPKKIMMKKKLLFTRTKKSETLKSQFVILIIN